MENILQQIERVGKQVLAKMQNDNRPMKPFPKKEVREMTEGELEQQRNEDDYIYHFMKEEQIAGRRID
jgi:hypothetical protein